MGQELSSLDAGSSNANIENYFLKNSAFTGTLVVFLLLVSWRYGQSSVEERFDPVKAAHEERDAAIKERDDAQGAWAAMGTKHERAIGTIIKLQDEIDKNFKDLPWLHQRHYELAEANIVQYNEIQSLKVIQQKYDGLLQDVSAYGSTAKRPEEHQQMSESLHRELEIAKHHLQTSEKTVKALKEMIEAQQKKANEENDLLLARLKKNARSAAYWTKFGTTRAADQRKPAWGVRCACTEAEITYGHEDQTPRIAELEATVAARDGTITRLRASRENVLKDDTSSASNATSTSLASPEDASTTTVHACKHEQHCEDLEKQVADDVTTITNLRKECQDLRDAASNESIADATRKEGKEISDLRKEKKSADEKAATDVSNLNRELSDSNTKLVVAQEIAAQREKDLKGQETIINKLEATQSGLEDAIKHKDHEIEELENANQEMAEQPAQDSAESLQRLKAANSNLEESRRQYAECKGQSESQSARISELEAAGRELQATMEAKDDEIAGLEEQLSKAPTVDSVQSQIESHNQAISTKNREYKTLCDGYNQILNQLQLTEANYNENREALNRVQQSDNAKHLELQRLLTEHTKFCNLHSDCDGQMSNLMNQLRQGGNAYTDLQVRYNTQATELDTAKQNAGELRNQVVNLQQENANLKRATPTSETDVEKYRLEGETRIRPIWQANVDREMSALTLRLETSEGAAFKLQHQLQQAKTQATPLREMQVKSREDAVKAREDALEPNTDAMDHDQQGGPKAEQREIKALESKLAAATKETGDARHRKSLTERQLTKERKERKDEKDREQARHEREMKKEKEDFEKRSNIQKLRLEGDNPLKGVVSKLQNDVARLERELKERK